MRNSVITSSVGSQKPAAAGAHHNKAKPKRSTREKIDKMVADGAKNYPAYLKLIYTGDSELSSEDEFCADQRVAATATGLQTSSSTSSSSRREGRAERPTVAVAMNGRAPDAGRQKPAFTPESDKLLDPGREKLPTPTAEGNGVQFTDYVSDEFNTGTIMFISLFKIQNFNILFTFFSSPNKIVYYFYLIV